MFLREAQETLVDPVKRFGYDRFGPDIQKWGELSTMRDIFLASLTRSVIPSYVIGFVMMLMLNWLWWSNWGRYVSTPLPSACCPLPACPLPSRFSSYPDSY